MTTSTVPLQPDELPSKRKLAVTTAIAVAVAATLLVTVVMPAEYGRDPLGTGRKLGLTALSSPPPAPKEVAELPAATTLVPSVKGPVSQYAGQYKIDDIQFELGPYEFLEYKYRLERGATMLYSWAASAPVVSDLHGDPDGAAKDAAQSFDKEDRTQASGAFTAPFAGIHGWFWENPGGDTVTITVKTAGFYSSAVEFRSDRTRRAHAVTDLSKVSVVKTSEEKP
jgi:hypothetical protein